MDQATAQIPVAVVLMARVMEVAVLIPASRATKVIRVVIIKVIRVVIIKVIKVVIIKVIRVVTINNPARGVSSSNNSLDIKVIQSS